VCRYWPTTPTFHRHGCTDASGYTTSGGGIKILTITNTVHTVIECEWGCEYFTHWAFWELAKKTNLWMVLQ